MDHDERWWNRDFPLWAWLVGTLALFLCGVLAHQWTHRNDAADQQRVMEVALEEFEVHGSSGRGDIISRDEDCQASTPGSVERTDESTIAPADVRALLLDRAEAQGWTEQAQYPGRIPVVTTPQQRNDPQPRLGVYNREFTLYIVVTPSGSGSTVELEINGSLAGCY